MTVQVSMLIGVPGSGKSTWAEKIIRQTAGEVRYISTDAIREQRFGDVADMSHNAEVFMIMKNSLQAAIKSGLPVILDATFVTAAERSQYIKLAKSHGAEVTAYYSKVGLDEALQRNAKRERKVPPAVIRERFAELEEPTAAEGFDRIVILDSAAH